MKTLSLNRLIIVSVILLLAFCVVSCQKENNAGGPGETTELTEEEARTYSEESIQSEASFDDIGDISMVAAEEEGEASVYGRMETGRYMPLFAELRLRLGPCVNITVTPNNNTYPKTITIDFGPTGCLCADGKYRRGAIVIHLTAPIRRPGAVMTITFDDFYLNRAHIEGTKIVTNLSQGGNIKFTVQVVGGKVTFPNGRGYQYSGIKYVKQVEGGDTRFIRDDVFSVEGRSKTEFNGGMIIHLNTETGLTKKVICPWISNGLLKIRINTRELYLNFAAPDNGECDNKALLTWNNGNNHLLITLP